MGYLSNVGCKSNKIWHKGSVGDGDDALTSNRRTGQRKSAIPLLMMNIMMSVTLVDNRQNVSCSVSDL